MPNENLRSNLRILQARRVTLAQPLPTVQPVRPSSNDCNHLEPLYDAFHLESNAFYLHNLNSHPHPSDTSQPTKKQNKNTPDNRHTNKPKQPAGRARVGKPPSKRQRFIANWTPQMDKVIRKALAKHGWGCWTKIASSGKLPQEYTPKMISNRARAIGLSHTKPELWGLDPLFHTHAKLYNFVLRQMCLSSPPVYSHHFPGANQPSRIRLVNISGLVVFLSRHNKFVRFLLDDGTGTARCIIWLDNHTPIPDFALGDHLDVKGRLEWRDHIPVVVVSSAKVVVDPHQELSWWLDVQRLYQNSYQRANSH